MTQTDAETLRQIESTPTVLSLLRRTALERPDHPAIIFMQTPTDATPRVVSYAALLGEVDTAVRALRQTGLARDDAVAILLPTVPEVVTLLIAAAETGIAFPVNLLLNADAMSSQLTTARAKVAVLPGSYVDPESRSRLGEMVDRLPGITTVVETATDNLSNRSLTWQQFLDLAPDGTPDSHEPDPFRVAALFHSGGTTGAPKLAQLSGRNLVAGACMAAGAINWRADDRMLLAMPLFHIGGVVDGVLASIAAGGTVILATSRGARHPEFLANVWSMVDRTHATLYVVAPTTLGAAARVPVGATNLDRLRGIVTGSTTLPPVVAQAIEELTGVPICQLYGMTETSGIVTAQPADGTFRAPAVGNRAPCSEVIIGNPINPADPRGEVHVRGPHVFCGYLTDTGTRDAPDAGGWLPTGDLGEFGPDDQLRLSGRIKDVIIRSGHNLDPLMIEDAALQHPAVLEAVAVPIPDAYAGEVPALFVTLNPGFSPTPDDIRSDVADRVAEPPARPKEIFIVTELPRTLIGKIARYKLRQQAAVWCGHRLLAGLPIDDISCDDVAAKQLRLAWSSTATEADRQRATALLGASGLTAC